MATGGSRLTPVYLYNYSERGSSLCCCVYEHTDNRLAKIDGQYLCLLETGLLLQDHKFNTNRYHVSL